MKSTQLTQMALLTLTSMIMMGCLQQPTMEVKVPPKEYNSIQESPKTEVFKQTNKVESNQKLEDILQNLSNDKNIQNVTIKSAKKRYKDGEPISFIIDTQKRVGFLYIVSIDKEDITFLQPNPHSPLEELRGERAFPQDFTNGKFRIGATKHCKGCAEEKTTIYAFLTKEPIENIASITKEQLLSFNKNRPTPRFRGTKIIIVEQSKNRDFSIGKLEFVVE